MIILKTNVPMYINPNCEKSFSLLAAKLKPTVSNREKEKLKRYDFLKSSMKSIVGDSRIRF